MSILNEIDMVLPLTGVEQEIANLFDKRYSHPCNRMVMIFYFRLTTIDDLLTHEFICDMEVGEVIASKTASCQDFIAIKTKVGVIVLFQDDDKRIGYRCEESYAICASAKQAGFGTTAGRIETVDQIKHIFKVADSYLGERI